MFVIVILLSETLNGLLTDSSMKWNGMSQEKRRVRRHCRTSSILFSLFKVSYNNLKHNSILPVLLSCRMWKCFQVLFWILLIVYSSQYQCPDWGTLTFNNESWRAAQDNKALRAALVTLCRARLGGNCGLYSGGGGGECRESVNPAPHRLGHTFTHSEVSRGQTRQFLVIWYLPLFFSHF